MPKPNIKFTIPPEHQFKVLFNSLRSTQATVQALSALIVQLHAQVNNQPLEQSDALYKELLERISDELNASLAQYVDVDPDPPRKQ